MSEKTFLRERAGGWRELIEVSARGPSGATKVIEDQRFGSW